MSRVCNEWVWLTIRRKVLFLMGPFSLPGRKARAGAQVDYRFG